MPVGAGDGRAQDVAHGQVGRHLGVAHDDVARLAVLAHHGDGAGPVGVGGPGQERLVAAAVEDGPGVVAHPPVDGHVGAHAGDVLDRAHPVEGEAGGGGDGPSRLGRDPGPDPRRQARLLEDLGPLGDAWARPRRRRRPPRGPRPGTARAGRGAPRSRPAPPPPSRTSGAGRSGCRCGRGSPTRSKAGEPAIRSTARAASPLARPKPNLESTWPVITYSWVWASTPGVTRTITRVGRPSSAWSASSRRISSKESTTTSHAEVVGPGQLRRPTCCCRGGRGGPAGTPAARATCSSPPVATSTCMPSSWARRAMARHRNAFDP